MSFRALPSEFQSPKDFFELVSGRKEIQLLSDSEIQNFFIGKKILITGAGGTIGSAVARRLNEAKVANTYYLDRDESALHALALSLSDTAASHSANCLVADVRDQTGLINLFEEVQPDLVIHTAALKHLVVLERFPREGALTNIYGTLNVLQAAKKAGISQILNVSTDKAALPTSILGKTKLIAEHLTLESNSNMLLTSSVRFGNVFASRGSVIETFVHQIRNDLPVTITHPDVTRFFMSHNEAANLILASCSMKENAVFVQEMGSRIRILEIVSKLAESMGKTPQIHFVGLQPGEKLHEDLYEKKFISTSNPAIVKLPFQENESLLETILLQEPPRDHQQALEQIHFLISKIGALPC